MLQLTIEWIQKAEADFETAKRELAVTQRPNYDAVCFHAQQCIEKYLKSFLQESSIPFPRTHDLPELLALALGVEPAWASLEPDLNVLTAFAVEYRYPGESSDMDEAQEAFEKCEVLRGVIRSRLGM
jgi:HEPN domain-containing protein